MQAFFVNKTDRISELLDVRPGVIAIVGGGGKTTLMYCLADELKRRGKVIVTTTTHIYCPTHIPVLTGATRERVKEALAADSILCVVEPGRLDKMQPPAMPIAELASLADYCIVEADGAKHLPLKTPAPHEPAMPDETNLVIAVAGLDGVGKRINETVFRPERFAAIVGKSPEAAVTPDDCAMVLQHCAGLRKSVPKEARFCVILNKADTAERIIYGEQIAEAMESDLADRVLITSLCERPVFHRI